MTTVSVREELVGGGNRDGLADPPLEDVEIDARFDARLLVGGNAEAARFEDGEHGKSFAASATEGVGLLVKFALVLVGAGRHEVLERSPCRCAERNTDQVRIE